MRLRSTFIVAQVAVSLVLVIAGGLFVRALGRAASIDPGFDDTNVDVVMLDLALTGYQEPDALAFADRLRSRVRALPGVHAAAFAADLPLDGGRMGFGTLRVPGLQPPNGADSFRADWNAVSPDYFKTLKMRLVSGRDFTDQDAAGAPGAIIINEAMARSVWQTTDVLGRQFEAQVIGNVKTTLTVVGVAPDAQVDSLGAKVGPFVYVPLAQRYMSRASLLVKSTGGGMIPPVRALVRELNPNLPVTTAMPLEQVTALMLIPQRIAGAVAGTLGVVVLLLAAIGIYGVTSVLGEPPHARDRHPHGTRGQSHVGAAPGHPPGTRADGVRRRARARGRRRRCAGAAQPAVRRQRAGPDRLRRIGAALCPGCAGRQLPARTPRDPGRSDDRPQGGVE